MYKIKITYSTGDSFGTYNDIGYLDYEWKNLEIAKENLKRIKEHYLWYLDTHGGRYQKKEHEEPEWHKGLEYYGSIKIKTDDEKEVIYHTFWTGYFETLQRAEIIYEDSEMVIEF